MTKKECSVWIAGFASALIYWGEKTDDQSGHRITPSNWRNIHMQSTLRFQHWGKKYIHKLIIKYY